MVAGSTTRIELLVKELFEITAAGGAGPNQPNKVNPIGPRTWAKLGLAKKYGPYPGIRVPVIFILDLAGELFRIELERTHRLVDA